MFFLYVANTVLMKKNINTRGGGNTLCDHPVGSKGVKNIFRRTKIHNFSHKYPRNELICTKLVPCM